MSIRHYQLTGYCSDKLIRAYNKCNIIMYYLKHEQQNSSVFIPDKTRDASVLNGFKNEPLEAVRISLYKDHNL